MKKVAGRRHDWLDLFGAFSARPNWGFGPRSHGNKATSRNFSRQFELRHDHNPLIKKLRVVLSI